MEGDNKTFSCVLCGNQLLSKEALQEHFRKHANKEIDSKGRLIPKAKTEDKGKNKLTCSTANSDIIQCEICSMNFATVTLAIQHKFRKHPESSSKYYCPFCGMQFPLKFTRDKHVQSHQGMSTIGSFPCPQCGVVFHNMGAINYHVKSNHKRIQSIFKPVPTPPPSKKIKINNANEAQSVYYCYLCGTEYIIKFNLQKHLENSHTEDERNAVPQDLIKCTTCDALFYNKKAYDTHNIYHKPDDLYVISEEQRLQTVTRVDQDFDIRRVQMPTDKFIPIDRPKKRRKQVSATMQTKDKEKLLLNNLDEELSPTSSIDSSDSESIKNKNEEKDKDESKIRQDKDSNEKDSTKTVCDVPNEDLKIKKDTKIKTYMKKKNLTSKNTKPKTTTSMESNLIMSKNNEENISDDSSKMKQENINTMLNNSIVTIDIEKKNKQKQTLTPENKPNESHNDTDQQNLDTTSNTIQEKEIYTASNLHKKDLQTNLTAIDMTECTVALNKFKSENKRILRSNNNTEIEESPHEITVLNKTRKRKISDVKVIKSKKTKKVTKKQNAKKKVTVSKQLVEIGDTVNKKIDYVINGNKSEDIDQPKVVTKDKNIKTKVKKAVTQKKFKLKSVKKIISKEIEDDIPLSNIKKGILAGSKTSIVKKISKKQIGKKGTKTKSNEESKDTPRKTRSQTKVTKLKEKNTKSKLTVRNDSSERVSKKRSKPQKKSVKKLKRN